jgi:hypothetical protein
MKKLGITRKINKLYVPKRKGNLLELAVLQNRTTLGEISDI